MSLGVPYWSPNLPKLTFSTTRPTKTTTSITTDAPIFNNDQCEAVCRTMCQKQNNINAQVANTVKMNIDKYHQSTGFHLFEVNGSPALGLILSMLALLIAVLVVLFCLRRCKRTVLKHLSLRNNNVAVATQAAPSVAAPMSPVPSAATFSARSLPIMPVSAPTLLAPPPRYEMVPLAESKSYAAPASAIPYGV